MIETTAAEQQQQLPQALPPVCQPETCSPQCMMGTLSLFHQHPGLQPENFLLRFCNFSQVDEFTLKSNY